MITRLLVTVTVVLLMSGISWSRYSLKVLGRSPTSVRLKLPESGGGVLMYVESLLARGSDPPWESLLILEDNDLVTLTGLRPATQYRLRWRTHGRVFSDVRVNTLREGSLEMVTTTTTKPIFTTTVLSQHSAS